MTWFANYIFAEPKPSVISEFCNVPEVSNGLYLVKNLDSFKWFDPSVRHGLPPGGFLVGREICNPEASAAEWHDDEIIAWHSFAGPEHIRVIEPRGVISREVDKVERAHLNEVLPPIEFLRFLKSISLNTGSVVGFYSCATWGGAIEEEFAWVFDKEDKIYRFRDERTILEFGEDGSRKMMNGMVLNLLLSHFGLELPSRYFALCTRSFNWEKYKINCK